MDDTNIKIQLIFKSQDKGTTWIRYNLCAHSFCVCLYAQNTRIQNTNANMIQYIVCSNNEIILMHTLISIIYIMNF